MFVIALAVDRTRLQSERVYRERLRFAEYQIQHMIRTLAEVRLTKAYMAPVKVNVAER